MKIILAGFSDIIGDYHYPSGYVCNTCFDNDVVKIYPKCYHRFDDIDTYIKVLKISDRLNI